MNIINKLIVQVVQLMPKPIVRFFANRYIAGDTLEEAVTQVKKLNSIGIMATVDVLGEAITTKDQAIEAKQSGLRVLKVIQSEKLDANLSIKPTQFGLLLDEEFCYQQVLELVKYASEFNNFVRLDMEDSSTTDKIINLFLRLKKDYSSVGIVFQSYMKRSFEDVKKLNEVGANYRLCKGIYIEPAEIAYKGRQDIRDSYLNILSSIFLAGGYVGVATHDDYLINGTKKIVKQMGLSPDKYEFQMLLGVREDLHSLIRNNGDRLRIYVPFGKDWYKYSIRRLKENPNMAMDIVKNIFRFS